MSAPLVVVSNRGPVAFRLGDDGTTQPIKAGGGLASTLGGGVRSADVLWVAAAMTDADRAVAHDAGANADLDLEGYRFRLIDIPKETFDAAYNVVANQTLWFWHHHLFDPVRRPVLDAEFRDAWAAFRAVNEAMAHAAADAAGPDATVLIHDYHLPLAPAMLRAQRPDLRIAHFTHTPFVNPAFLSILPDEITEELLLGMAGADACGFHAPRWSAAFEACWFAHPNTRTHPVPHTFVAPAAADHDEVAAVSASAACTSEAERLDREIGDCKRIVRVDRIEPSKNLLRGFWAYRTLLEQRPEWRGKVCLVALCYPSRESLEEYRVLHDDVELAAAALNADFGSAEWKPVILDTTDGFARSVAALRSADVLLVNPVRDGLNLVAYEGPVINVRDAPLLLSRETGAWDELGPAGAMAINPFDISGTADALHTALTMDDAERKERAERLRAVAMARTPASWLQRQLDAVSGS